MWKVWFHQTAQSEAAAKSEIQCNKCSLNANIYEATTSSRPGQAEEKFLVSVASATEKTSGSLQEILSAE